MSAELERLATTCLFPGFPGPEAPDWVRRELEGGLGGVVLFAWNVRDASQLARLAATLQAERDDVLVAIDEEGGDVTRLEAAAGSSYPGNLALGAVDDPALTERVAGAIAGDLSRVGVNLDLAPVADVNTNPDNPIIGVRAFGADAELAARHVRAFVNGLQGQRVAACAKHFPGHGDTQQDSHVELPTVETLSEEALRPFRAAIEAGVQAIMTAHIRVASVGEEPATLSPALLRDLLRGELGFDGMVITDALEMRAVSATVGVEEGAVRSIAAGADALCLGHDLGADAVKSVRAALVTAVREGRIPEQRLADAAGRVAEVGWWASGQGAEPAPGREIGLESARLALVAEGAVNLSRPPLVVELLSEPSMAAGARDYGLREQLSRRLPSCSSIRLREAPVDAQDFLSAFGDRQLVLVVQDAHRHAWQRAAVESLLAKGGDGIVVEVGLPVWRPRAARGYLATHGAGRVNLDAAAERLLAA